MAISSYKLYGVDHIFYEVIQMGHSSIEQP